MKLFYTIITRQLILSIGLLFITFSISAAPDYAREKRWADEITPELIFSDAVYLPQKNGHTFLGLLAEADNSHLGVIIVHGMGLHPDWGMIGTLRRGLYDAGYSTFSIQMPILASDASYKVYPALFPEAAERLQLSVTYLKNKGYKKIAIVSHSNGSRMSRIYMRTNPKDISAWVSLSLTQGDTFKNIKAPVLDLYGEQDLSHVLTSAKKRKQSLIHKTSKQIRIDDADHFFSGKEDSMLKAIETYLGTIR